MRRVLAIYKECESLLRQIFNTLTLICVKKYVITEKKR